MTTTLVLGGTGKTGSRVAAGCATSARTCASDRVPARCHSTGTTTPPGRGGARRRRLGVRVLLPGRLLPGAAGRVAGFARTAVAHGARRLVMLSGRGEPEAAPAEDGVRGSGAEWTVLRCAWFAQNFSEHFLLQPVLDGMIALPAADVAEPFLDVDDVADVAVATLTRDGHAGGPTSSPDPGCSPSPTWPPADPGHRPRDRLPAGHRRAVRRCGARGRGPGRGDRTAIRPVRPRAQRAQRAPDRRRRTGAGPPAPRLRRLRARHRGHRRLVARGRRRAPMIGS